MTGCYTSLLEDIFLNKWEITERILHFYFSTTYRHKDKDGC